MSVLLEKEWPRLGTGGGFDRPQGALAEVVALKPRATSSAARSVPRVQEPRGDRSIFGDLSDAFLGAADFDSEYADCPPDWTAYHHAWLVAEAALAAGLLPSTRWWVEPFGDSLALILSHEGARVELLAYNSGEIIMTLSGPPPAHAEPGYRVKDGSADPKELAALLEDARAWLATD